MWINPLDNRVVPVAMDKKKKMFFSHSTCRIDLFAGKRRKESQACTSECAIMPASSSLFIAGCWIILTVIALKLTSVKLGIGLVGHF